MPLLNYSTNLSLEGVTSYYPENDSARAVSPGTDQAVWADRL